MEDGPIDPTDGSKPDPLGNDPQKPAVEGPGEGLGEPAVEPGRAGVGDNPLEVPPPDVADATAIEGAQLEVAAAATRRKWMIGGGIAAAVVVAILAVLAFTGGDAAAEEPQLNLRAYRVVGVAVTPATTTTTTSPPTTTTTVPATTTTVAETTTTVPATTSTTEAEGTDTTVAPSTTVAATTTVPATTTTAAPTTTAPAPTTTVAAPATTEAPPATDPPSGPQPADPAAVTVIEAFVDDFNAALEAGDNDFLLASLSPISTDVFGEEACTNRVENHVSRVRGVTLDTPILGPADYTVEIPDVDGAYELTVQSVYTSDASYTVDDEASGQEVWLQIDDDGQVSYIINCGGDEVEVS